MKKNLFIPALMLLAFTFGCSKNETGSAPANTAGNGAGAAKKSDTAPKEFAPSGDPMADIQKVGDRFLAQKTFRASMLGEGETQMRAMLEFVSPDRHRLKTGRDMETIVIGQTTYIKTGGSWRKMPMSLDTTITDMRDAFNKEAMKWFSDVKYAGEETVDERAAYVYSYHNKGPGAGVGENDSKIWVAKDDGIPIKIEAVYKSGKLKKMMIEYDYKTPVTIEPPVQ